MSFHAEEISSYDNQAVSFGMDRDKVVFQLRKLADEIEKQHRIRDAAAEYILLQSAETRYTVEADDYAMTTITLKFATKKGAPPFERR